MKLIWKIYSVLYILLVIIIIVGDFTDPHLKLKLTDYIDTLISLPTIVVVTAWAWRKAIWYPKLWLIYAVAFLSYDSIYNLFLDNHARGSLTDLLIG
jgi:hypothetical protein